MKLDLVRLSHTDIWPFGIEPFFFFFFNISCHTCRISKSKVSMDS